MKDFKSSNFIILGPAGSGKGTQSKLLLKKFKSLYYIYTGDLLRNLASKNTDTGKRIKKVLSSGELVIDEIAAALWINSVSLNVKQNQGILLDGSPRRVEEAATLFDFLKFLDRVKNTQIFIINISGKESIKRLIKRRRKDDRVNEIKRRLAWYKINVIPELNYLKRKGIKITKINGEQSIEDVFKDILKTIKKK
jgi:adenylate kinase